jgi:hypothetical protein
MWYILTLDPKDTHHLLINSIKAGNSRLAAYIKVADPAGQAL